MALVYVLGAEAVGGAPIDRVDGPPGGVRGVHHRDPQRHRSRSARLVHLSAAADSSPRWPSRSSPTWASPSSPRLPSRSRTPPHVPRATYLALLISGGLYVLISLGVYGTLTVEEVIASGDTALAEAAEPALGQAGYTMMADRGVLGDGLVDDANLFAFGNLMSSLAGTPEFPPVFGRQIRVLGAAGVLITVGTRPRDGAVVRSSTIASVGSAVALVIFAWSESPGSGCDTNGRAWPCCLAAVSATLVAGVVRHRHRPDQTVYVRGHRGRRRDRRGARLSMWPAPRRDRVPTEQLRGTRMNDQEILGSRHRGVGSGHRSPTGGEHPDPERVTGLRRGTGSRCVRCNVW